MSSKLKLNVANILRTANRIKARNFGLRGCDTRIRETYDLVMTLDTPVSLRSFETSTFSLKYDYSNATPVVMILFSFPTDVLYIFPVAAHPKASCELKNT